MKKHILWAAAAVVAIGTMCTAGALNVKAQAASEELTIADGVYIGTVDVGGMTETQAFDAIDAYVEGIMNTTFTLTADNGSIEVTASDMGITADASASVAEALSVTHTGSLIARYKDSVTLKNQPITLPLTLEVDKQATAQLIFKNRSTLNIEAEDGTLKRDGDKFVFVPGVVGREVNEVESVYAINEFLAYAYDGTSSEIALVVDEIQPRGTEEELMQITDLLGSFSTDYSSSASGRKTNLANACSKINGSVLYPGEEFSVYEAITPITIENGYAIAGAYENGQTVDSVGGGVCQVATTLYNAVIRAELDVTMRYNHSMIVGYVSPSSDAAIAGNYKDLRFVNNYDHPIYIEGIANGSTLAFRVYGVETRDPGREVSFESETLEEDDPEIKFQLDGSFELGYWHTEQSAHRRVVAQLWKVVKVNGVEESREVFNHSTYNPSPKIITIGTGNCTAEMLALISEAAATGDEAAMHAAIEAAQAMAGGATTDEPQTPDDAQTPSEPGDAQTPSESDESEDGEI